MPDDAWKGAVAGTAITSAILGGVWLWTEYQRKADLRKDSQTESLDGTAFQETDSKEVYVASHHISSWERQDCRPKRLILIRHGESEANVDRMITSVVPDHALHLTLKGREQATEAGIILKELIGDESVHFLVSPYVRTRETFMGIAAAWGGSSSVKWSQEILIREQEYGNYDKSNMEELHATKKDFGQFYYRFPEGESVVDVYARAGLVVNDLYRRWTRATEQNLVLVSHGMFLLTFLMRFFRYEVKDFYQFAALKNCEILVLERSKQLFDLKGVWYPGRPDFEFVEGDLRAKLPRRKESAQAAPETPIWCGDVNAPLMSNAGKDTRGRAPLKFASQPISGSRDLSEIDTAERAESKRKTSLT